MHFSLKSFCNTLALLFLGAVLAVHPVAAQRGSEVGRGLALLPPQSRAVVQRLLSLSQLPAGTWKMHEGDLPHGEAVDLDDSGWQNATVGAHYSTSAVWFRQTIQLPTTLNGYDLSGARIWFQFHSNANGPIPEIIYFNGRRVALGEDLEPEVLFDDAKPGDKVVVAVKLLQTIDVKSFRGATLSVDFSEKRPNPQELAEEFLSAAYLLPSLAPGDASKMDTLYAAIGSVDVAALDHADSPSSITKSEMQFAFDTSLKAAQARLEALRPLMRQATFLLDGNAHIDAAWLWPWTESVDVVKRTYGTALQLMDEYPDYVFTQSAAAYNEWLAEKYPELNAEIKQRIKEGRWEIVGGMWVEPDLNMPDGESLVRQILVGKRYFEKNFGVDVKIGWNPDSFGYNWQLPQIYKKSGMDYFVTQKLMWAHEFTTFPYKFFWWQSPDGSRLLTYFPHDYADPIDAEPLGSQIAVWMPSIYGPKLTDHPEMMHLYGVGDHGGGPTRVMLDHAEQLRAPDAVFPRLEFSFARDFFNDMEKKLPSMQVPTWDGELYFQYHRGVFTTQAETKRRIRQSEEIVLNAEKFASLASLYGKAYPQDAMLDNWKQLLFDHFHDIMPGSGIAVNYLDAKRNLEIVDRSASDITRKSLEEIAAHVNTEGEGVPVMLFNSMSWPRTDVAGIDVQLPAPARQVAVVDAHGKPAESQLISLDKETHRAKLLLLAHTPSMGYETYFVRAAASAPQVHSLLKASSSPTQDVLENEFIRVKVDPQSGCMTSLFDKRSKTEALAPAETDTGGPKDRVCGNLLQTFVDKPKRWDAWNIDADFEKQHWDLDKADEVRLVENGPLRAVIEVKNHFQNSTFVRDITLYAGVPRLDVKMQAEWHEKHILLKVAFPLSAHNDKATFEIPYGSVERPTTRNTPAEQAQFEVPAQRWADISDATHGFSLLNDCKYGYDAKGNVLRLSLLRSPEWPDPHADEGHHEFTYSLYPHGGGWKDALTIRRGYELNYKLLAIPVEKHQGALAAEHSFLQVPSENVIVSAMKKAEDDNSLVVRFYEWAGKAGDVTLALPPGAQSAVETNLMEKPAQDLAVQNGAVKVPTKPYEIKTVKVQFASVPQMAAR